MNKPLSLVRYYALACKMHTCSSGMCYTQIYHQDGGHTNGNKHRHHFPPPQWLPPPLRTQSQAHEAKGHRVDTQALQEYDDVHGFYHARVEHLFACLWVVRNVWTRSAAELHGHVRILLHFTQFCICRQTNIRYRSVTAALIGAIMCTYFKMEELSMCSRRSTLIPNHNIRRGSRYKVTYPYYIPKVVHSHGYLINMACVLGIEKDIRQIPTHRAYGHAIGKMRHERGELGIMVVWKT